MPTRRATRKKMRPKFKVGDVVTWDLGLVSHRVIEVRKDGVVVDSTSASYGKIKNGRRYMLIAFAPASKSKRCPGPPRHSKLKPDVGIIMTKHDGLVRDP